MKTPNTRLPGWQLAAGSVFAVLLLAGCYEDPWDVTLYDPGVYKGEEDPLMARAGSEELTETLRDRFQAGQTDR